VKKFSRQIIVLLMLALGLGPALAAACTTSCMTQSMHNTQTNVSNDQMLMADMHCDDCPKATPSSDQDHQSPSHNGCSMAGCHFAQTLPFSHSPKAYIADFSYLAPIYFNPLGISADLSPPLKPPA